MIRSDAQLEQLRTTHSAFKKRETRKESGKIHSGQTPITIYGKSEPGVLFADGLKWKNRTAADGDTLGFRTILRPLFGPF